MTADWQRILNTVHMCVYIYAYNRNNLENRAVANSEFDRARHTTFPYLKTPVY